MELLSILAIAIGLAMDAMAVSVAAGLTLERVTGRHIFRVGFHFGLFQAIMPLIGWSIGRSFADYVAPFDHWIAFALLAAIGGKMLWESRHDEKLKPQKERTDPTRGVSLVTLSIATSIDALAVGLSMAMVGVSVWIPALVIGLVTAGLSVLGIIFGSRLGLRFRRWADLIGGVVLLLIGLKILVEHTLG